MNKAVFISALLAHFIGDFVLQTNKIAAGKGKSVKGVTYHCMWIFAAYVILMLPFDLKTFVIVISFNTITHFMVDYFKLKRGKLKYPTCFFFVDQIMHILCIYISVRNIGGYSEGITPQWIAFYELMVLVIISTYVATVLIKQLFFEFGKFNFAMHPFFFPKERPMDMLFCLVILTSYHLRSCAGYLLSTVIACVYYGLHQKVVSYDRRLLIEKILFYVVFIGAVFGIYYKVC